MDAQTELDDWLDMGPAAACGSHANTILGGLPIVQACIHVVRPAVTGYSGTY